MPDREFASAVDDLIERRLAALAEAGCAPPSALDREQLRRLLLVSDYAFERLRRDPTAITALGETPVAPDVDVLLAADGPDVLRRYRHALSLDILWREVGGAALEETLAASTRQAETCIQLALATAEKAIAERHGWVRDDHGEPRRLAIFALGKLGGGELNFSSDVDLVFGYAGSASEVSDGARALDAENWMTRVGQRLIQLLGDITAEGFAFRVDMRLRPFGSAGRLALSFDAMEQYFQREGRDWERYAWIKARPVAGDLAAGEGFLEDLRPFVYRRYLDYTAFEGLREMKGLIEAEVRRRDLAGHLKLGPGGIREIEFVAQLLQLVRGGREPALRRRGLLATLDALLEGGYLDDAEHAQLRDAYRFLRRLENRVQMLRDDQTHELPEDQALRLRLARGLDLADVAALESRLAAHRSAVSARFEAVFEAPKPSDGDGGALRDYWNGIEDEGAQARLEAAGFAAAEAEAVHARLRGFARAADHAGMSQRARKRLDRVMPELLARLVALGQPGMALDRVLNLLQSVLRRSSYLALLAEQPDALRRVVELMARSAWLAARISAHPLLLDDLLERGAGEIESTPEWSQALRHEMAARDAADASDDVESRLQRFNEFKQSATFRIAMGWELGRIGPSRAAEGLAEVAALVVERTLPLAALELTRRHGRIGGIGAEQQMIAVGYGSLGGGELGFASDLDLVFLFDGAWANTSSDGERELDAPGYFVRVVQRAVNLLDTLTPGGKLYEVDLRLRPDGAKGLLVSSLESFVDYQRQRAWTWEHQALVRARCVAGSAELARRFEQVRREVLAAPRDTDRLSADIASMRERMRAELDRSRGDRFDLKHGRGGLVDLEFLLQWLVLRHAATRPALLSPRRTFGLLRAAAQEGVLEQDRAEKLLAAHELLLARAQACTLEQRPRQVIADAEVSVARAAIWSALREAGLVAADAPGPEAG